MTNYLNKPQNIEANFEDYKDRLASITKFHDDINIEFSNFEVALLGIEDDQNTSDTIREYFYELYKPENLKIIDLGNISLEQNFETDYQKINNIFKKLIKNNIKLMFLGNKKETNHFFYKYFQKNLHKFNTVHVDSKIDYQLSNNSDKFLNYFDRRNNIFENFYFLGYQKYLTNPKIKEKITELGFSTYRLSEIKKNIIEFEPYIRISDIVSIDISSVKAADAPACKTSSPNGFSANEICHIAYFAGLSDKIKTINLTGINLKYDLNNTTAKLTAQIFWHFLDALSTKKNIEYNKQNDFAVYFIKLPNELNKKDLKFLHCKNTKRWWVELNIKNSKKQFACSYNDYESAKTQKLTPRIKEFINIQN